MLNINATCFLSFASYSHPTIASKSIPLALIFYSTYGDY